LSPLDLDALKPRHRLIGAAAFSWRRAGSAPPYPTFPATLETEADAVLADYGVELGQDDDTVILKVTVPRRGVVSRFTGRPDVQFTALLEVPAHVGLEVRTTGGNITLGVDPTSNWDLDAATSGGSVRVRGLAFTATTANRSRAKGTINAGGASLRARTSGGSIMVSAASASAEK